MLSLIFVTRYVQTLLRKIRAYEEDSKETGGCDLLDPLVVATALTSWKLKALGVSNARAESPVSRDGGPQNSPGVRSIDPNPCKC